MDKLLENRDLQLESDITTLNGLMEIFEQIGAYNEICYQTIQLALFSALEKLKDRENHVALTNAIEQIRKTIDKCRNASDKIEHLSHSGRAITSKILVEKDEKRMV
jgi:hypothetical protein